MNEVNVFCRAKKNQRYARIARQAIVDALHLLKKKHCAVEVFIVGNSEMVELHGKSTNVLAYPTPKKFPHPETKNNVLGEIYLNPTYIRQHGENFRYCTVHGLLHLSGYEHKNKKGAIKMEQKESRLLKKLQNRK